MYLFLAYTFIFAKSAEITIFIFMYIYIPNRTPYLNPWLDKFLNDFDHEKIKEEMEPVNRTVNSHSYFGFVKEVE